MQEQGQASSIILFDLENYIDEGEATAPETLSIPLLSEEVKSQL